MITMKALFADDVVVVVVVGVVFEFVFVFVSVLERELTQTPPGCLPLMANGCIALLYQWYVRKSVSQISIESILSCWNDPIGRK